jgi:DNA-binding CsgD family transcriptional regulator
VSVDAGAAGEASTLPSPGTSLGLALDERVEEFARLLTDTPLRGIRPSGRRWLHSRYVELVPLVLPAALRAVEYGEPVDPACLAALRVAAARRHDDPDASLAVVLRGAVPALRVFGHVMHSAARGDAARTVLATSRAAVVAHELGSCWAEAWLAARSDAAAALAGDEVTVAEVELVPADSDLDEADKAILTLAASGLSTEAIAQETAYSRQAVSWHLGRLMRVWHAPNRTALVSLAFVKGWIDARRVRRRA